MNVCRNMQKKPVSEIKHYESTSVLPRVYSEAVRF